MNATGDTSHRDVERSVSIPSPDADDSDANSSRSNESDITLTGDSDTGNHIQILMDRIATQDGIIREQELVIERLREDKSVLETDVSEIKYLLHKTLTGLSDLQTRDKERRREIRELKEQLDKQKSDRVTQLVVVGVSGGVIGFMLKACGFSLSSVWDCLRPTPPPPPTYLDLSAEELPGQVQATFAAYITQTLHLSKSI